MLGRFLNILFPSSCPICHKPSEDYVIAPLCRECWMKAVKYTGPACQKCGKPLPSSASITCLECLKGEPSFHYARSYGMHEGTLKAAVNLFKFRRIRRLCEPLSEKIMEIILPPVDLVLPVPLHQKRLREREFNQSALIGKHIARRLGAPLSVRSLVRNRHTIPQVGLSAQERRKNIRNAFTVSDMNHVRGKRIMLVDDVFTTGATVRECSRVLRKAGAKEVFVITLTHAMSD